MQDKNSQIATIKMAEYDPPQKVERPHSNGKWVEYGYDNKYPDYLLDLYRNSPTNHAVIDKMVKMITGKCVGIIYIGHHYNFKAQIVLF